MQVKGFISHTALIQNFLSTDDSSTTALSDSRVKRLSCLPVGMTSQDDFLLVPPTAEARPMPSTGPSLLSNEMPSIVTGNSQSEPSRANYVFRNPTVNLFPLPIPSARSSPMGRKRASRSGSISATFPGHKKLQLPSQLCIPHTFKLIPDIGLAPFPPAHGVPEPPSQGATRMSQLDDFEQSMIPQTECSPWTSANEIKVPPSQPDIPHTFEQSMNPEKSSFSSKSIGTAVNQLPTNILDSQRR